MSAPPPTRPLVRRTDTPAERLARGGSWLTLTLALVMLLAVSESLIAADWTDGLAVVRYAMLGGALLAFALSLTRWDGFFPALYSFLASLFWITTLFSRLVFTSLSTQDGIRELLRRNGEWLVALFSRQASADNLIFITQLAFLGWWIGYLALWSLMRHQSLFQAMLPPAVALIVNAYFAADGMTGYVILFMATVLLLAIRVELARNETRWQLTRVRYAPDIAVDFLKAGILFAAVVITLAWWVPSLATRGNAARLLRPFEGSWQTFQDTWQRMYKSLNPGRGTTGAVAFGRTALLGGPVSLSDRPVFDAETPERTYWRAAMFDVYTGRGWINTDNAQFVVEANELLGEPVYAATRAITATIFPLAQGQIQVFGPPQITRVSVPVDADGTLLPGVVGGRSVSLLRSRVDPNRLGSYQVVAAVSDAAPERLRGDTDDYPQWIRDRYLQLPDTPDRIRTLAEATTAAFSNPYDKAEALEALLRTYRYDQAIAAPPDGADAVDYFLFDIKAGYCDYYASAMVVMLRAVGLPARFVVGYTPGQAQAKQERLEAELPRYRVLELNAHAWPEVYFPTFGWVQFEPTASEPLLVRPSEGLEPGLTPDQQGGAGPAPGLGPDQSPDQAGQGLFPETNAALAGRWLARNWGWLATGGLLVAAGAVIWRWRVLRRRRAVVSWDEELLGRLFELLGVWAARLRIHWPPSHTPLEHAAQFGNSVPEAAPAAERIADLFVARQYGHQRPAPEALAETDAGWQQLRLRLWRRWLELLVRPAEEHTRPTRR